MYYPASDHCELDHFQISTQLKCAVVSRQSDVFDLCHYRSWPSDTSVEHSQIHNMHRNQLREAYSTVHLRDPNNHRNAIVQWWMVTVTNRAGKNINIFKPHYHVMTWIIYHPQYKIYQLRRIVQWKIVKEIRNKLGS